MLEKKWNCKYLIYILLIIISLLYGYHKTIMFPPYSIHQWRQADGLSIAANYYKEGMNFFEPKIHFQYSEQGRAVGEFPIIYYLNAVIWKITGQSYFTARMINLLIVFWGLISLFITVKIISKSSFLSIITTLFVFSSPVIAYYSNNFLVNMPALGLAFTSWYYFVRYVQEKSIKYLVVFSLFSCLSVLLRTTMLISILPIIVIFLLEKFNVFERKIFVKKTWLEAVLLLLPVFLILTWFIYARGYNIQNNSVYFLTTIRPIWSLSSGAISEVWHKFSLNILPSIYPIGFVFVMVISIVYVALNLNKINKYLVVFGFTIFIGLILYLILWFANLDVHDYYLIELFLFVPILFVLMYSIFKAEFSQLANLFKIKVMLVLLLGYSVCYCTIGIRMKYNFKKTVLTDILFTKYEIDLWNWYHWNYGNTFKAYETITPYLRSIGIRREDVVVSIPDPSPNVSLFFMDQKGYTSLYQEGKVVTEQLDFFVRKGAKYLVVNDTSLITDEILNRYCQKEVGRYKNIYIYKLIQ